ncbi:MAG: hypothetical protein LBM70_00465 [Victivallales bacterium]|jgi:hypothetical protein|nr:hypothetical protein [Victivallales bacterium]
MAEYKNHSENWNEFQWEQEIRRDERRISCYFRELPGCLDLPGEEEMIFSSLLSQPDLVPTGGDADSLRFWLNDDQDDENFDESDDLLHRRPGADIVNEIDRLATEWNICCAAILRKDLKLHGLGIVCAFGKLLARAVDFIDTDAAAFRGLALSLGKRTIADLNELVGALENIGVLQHSLRPRIALAVELLGHVRERLIDQVEELRK